jgi:hypothetical protein
VHLVGFSHVEKQTLKGISGTEREEVIEGGEQHITRTVMSMFSPNIYY